MDSGGLNIAQHCSCNWKKKKAACGRCLKRTAEAQEKRKESGPREGKGEPMTKQNMNPAGLIKKYLLVSSSKSTEESAIEEKEENGI